MLARVTIALSLFRKEIEVPVLKYFYMIGGMIGLHDFFMKHNFGQLVIHHITKYNQNTFNKHKKFMFYDIL